ncbi:MAG: 50S ribosomal protein L23 [Methanomicrobiales archaeon]|jgi:large subunit ribosomal protein L23|nr:50S ribosomal protein L23 [Methanomicrobiales archaeon]
MVLSHPYVTEKAMIVLDSQSKIQFIVSKESTKVSIKREIEASFDQEVTRIRTIMTMKGQKKAIISFKNKKAAEEILSRLGIM